MPADPAPSADRSRDRVVDELAARWLARRQKGLSASEHAEFRGWVIADPRHAAAIGRLDAQASALDWPVYSGTAARVLAGLEISAQRRRRKRRRMAAALACASAIALIGYFGLPVRERTTPVSSLVVHAPVNQILPDGSTVQLSADAEYELAFSERERRIRLVRGSAHFSVHHDAARPFVVTAATLHARAVGTAFLVGIEPDQVALVVTEGTVAIDFPSKSAPAPAASPATPSLTTLALVDAGESVTVTSAGAEAMHAPRILHLSADGAAERLKWRIPRLVFDGTPLRDVVAVINRHIDVELVTGEAAVASIRVSGAVRADRVDALLELLEVDHRVFARTEGRRIHLERR